jgi:hypothetical protein
LTNSSATSSVKDFRKQLKNRIIRFMLCAPVAIIDRHERTIEQIARHLKSKATMALTRAGIHPLVQYRKKDGTFPTPWSEGIWSVFVNNESQLGAAIKYVERHPVKEGLPPRHWPFVKPFRV